MKRTKSNVKKPVNLSLTTLKKLAERTPLGQSYSDTLRLLLGMPGAKPHRDDGKSVIRLDRDVYAELTKHGKFGESFEQVLLRVLKKNL